jgi:hypothetical protein
MIKVNVVIFGEYHSYQGHTKFYPISFTQGKVHTWTKLLGIISVGFEVTDQPLFAVFIRQALEKMEIQ